MRLIVSLLLLLAGPALAAELRILSAASMQTVLKQVGPEFERASGHTLVVQYDTMGAIQQRVTRGESPDFIIGSGASIVALGRQGRLEPGSELTFARTGVGMAVPASDPAPPLANAGDFKLALAGAKLIVYADPAKGGAAGIHVAKLIDAMGLDVAQKTRYGAGGDVAELVSAQPPGTVGLTQITEIVGKPYVRYVGPLPPDLQNYTVFAAARPAGKPSSEPLEAFIRFMRSSRAVEAMKANGMELE
jgi:molybdate transport system substrate-binding protein